MIIPLLALLWSSCAQCMGPAVKKGVRTRTVWVLVFIHVLLRIVWEVCFAPCGKLTWKQRAHSVGSEKISGGRKATRILAHCVGGFVHRMLVVLVIVFSRTMWADHIGGMLLMCVSTKVVST